MIILVSSDGKTNRESEERKKAKEDIPLYTALFSAKDVNKR